MTADFNNDELERELRNALRRVEPERDFSAMVYAPVSAPRRISFWPPSRTLLALAATVLLAVLIPLSISRYEARQKRAEEARTQLVTALRITETKLQKTRQMVIRQLNRRNSL
jgi:hypothetical protein